MWKALKDADDDQPGKNISLQTKSQLQDMVRNVKFNRKGDISQHTDVKSMKYQVDDLEMIEFKAEEFATRTWSY